MLKTRAGEVMGSSGPRRRFLRLPQVMEKTGIGRSSIYAKVRDGSFPPPIQLSQRIIAWIEDEIDAWMEERITARKAIA